MPPYSGGMSYPPAVQPQTRRNPTWLWLVIGLVVLMLLAAGITGAVYLTKRFGGGPVKGDAAFTLHLAGPGGAAPDAGAVDRTKQILHDRLRKSGAGRPNVTTTGADTLRVTVAADDAELAKSVLAPGHLTFRIVLDQFHDSPGADCKADGPAVADPAGRLASAKAKLGDATYQAATALAAPDAPGAAKLTGFDKLTCGEVSALPAAVQYAVPGVTCAMLGRRAPADLADDAQLTACDESVKYRLDVARASIADLAGARAEQSQAGWAVTISFTPSGQSRWTDLTRDAIGKQVAIVVDDAVVSAPTIQAVIPGDAQISGSFDKAEASAIAASIGSGVLPTQVTITATDTVH